MTHLHIGSRRSRLALWQTHHVRDALFAQWLGLTCNIIEMETKGDKTLDRPLPEIGGKGLFTAELEEAIRSGTIDFAVHSLKDLPTEDSPGLMIGAILQRADARDALISRTGDRFEQLPAGAVIGTSSNRRRAQILARRPDLNVQSIRGNVETRIQKLLDGQYDAIILAMAGLTRLELTDRITEILAFNEMLPAPGQGALAVQCAVDHSQIRSLLEAIHDPAASRAITAERAFLSGLGGGCSAPIAALATETEFVGLVSALDGTRPIRVELGISQTSDPREVGRLAAEIAIDRGAKELLHG